MTILTDTNIGPVRTENQDRVKAEEFSEGTVVAVVCDGMGGQNAGSEAGELAVNIVFDRISAAIKNNPESSSVKNIMQSAVAAANAVIHDASMQDSTKTGMGSTCVAAVIYNGLIHLIGVGDSRIYMIKSDSIRQLTNDHTLVRMLFEQGKISEDEIQNHPKRRFITKAVGVEEFIEPDYFEEPYTEDAKLLLCTDGLSNYCSDKEMLNIINNSNPQDVAETLIEKAINNGGSDNITLALVYDK